MAIGVCDLVTDQFDPLSLARMGRPGDSADQLPLGHALTRDEQQQEMRVHSEREREMGSVRVLWSMRLHFCCC